MLHPYLPITASFLCRQGDRYVACSAGVFWTRECTFSYLGRHIGFGNCGGLGRGNIPPPTSPLHQSSTGQPSKMAASNPIYYLAFRSKITPALQANRYAEV